MNLDEPILFIGGPYDGQRKPWENSTPLMTVESISHERSEPDKSFYRLNKFKSEGRETLIIAIHESVDDVMKKLIEGYRKS